jgi:ribokinase
VPKLINLGSLCVDNVYSVDTIATVGETVASRNHAVFPGGKGLNQSLAASKAGADVHHIGCVGEDGDWLKEILAEAGVNVGNIRRIETPTGHAVIQVDAAGQNSIVISGGANRSIQALDCDVAFALLQPGDWLLLQNEINDIEAVLKEASDRDVKVAFNVAPVDGREQNYCLDAVRLLIVNEVEATALARKTVPDAALDALCGRFPTAHIVLTLGREGLLHGIGGHREKLAAYRVEAVDETAAGDAFVGYLMAGLLSGEEYAKALLLGSAAGALAVTQEGAASSIPEYADVLAMQDSN